MNISQALDICPDFTIKRDADGKVTCSQLIGSEVCRLPNHFRCELVMWKENQEAKARLPVISHSRAGAIETCPRNYYLRYVARAKPPIRPLWKDVGSAFAICRAKIDSGQSWEVEKEIPDEARAKLESILEIYERSAMRPQVTNEAPFIFEHRGFAVRGYVDAISKDRKRIYEWKYAQSDDSYTALTTCRQAAVYLKGIPEAEEVVIAVAKKTRHKMKDGESYEAFKSRVAAEYRSQEAKLEGNLVVYKTYPRSVFNVEREVDSLVDLAETMRFHEERGRFPPNYRNCQDCDFEEYCGKHLHVARLGEHERGDECSHPEICMAVKR